MYFTAVKNENHYFVPKLLYHIIVIYYQNYIYLNK